MPLNTLRLNYPKSSHPNDRIVFIKPLARSPPNQTSYEIADTFLHAIAAQCLPLMKKHYLSVTTLEEHEANPEFIGRNFNNGEIIQLVLKTKEGRWMPFEAVQMVMMHELAHNTHMNHGRDFWKARNLYAVEMKALWTKGYTGEGFWGGGRTLNDMGAVIGNNTLRSGELESLPLCGGTYRSRNRKRRGRTDKPELTWKEKRDRRIEKKFGKNGVALGEDEDKRLNLEINRKGPIGSKPRVAQSARGRDLRVAAALARFETNKKEVEDLQTAEGTDEEEDDYEDLDADLQDARDASGRKVLDSQGRGMIRICDDQDADDSNVHRELQELNTLDRYFNSFQLGQESTGVPAGNRASADKRATILSKPARTLESDTSNSVQSRRESPRKQQPSTSSFSAVQFQLTCSEPGLRKDGAHHASTPRQTRKASAVSPELEVAKPAAPSITLSKPKSQTPSLSKPPALSSKPPSQQPSMTTCPICSLENPSLNATCLACANVMDPRKDPRHWSCQSESCASGNNAYLNAGDVGLCGLCGARRK